MLYNTRERARACSTLMQRRGAAADLTFGRETFASKFSIFMPFEGIRRGRAGNHRACVNAINVPVGYSSPQQCMRRTQHNVTPHHGAYLARKFGTSTRACSRMSVSNGLLHGRTSLIVSYFICVACKGCMQRMQRMQRMQHKSAAPFFLFRFLYDIYVGVYEESLIIKTLVILSMISYL